MPLYIAILFIVLPLLEAFPHTPPRLERSVPFEQSFNLTETGWVVLDVETGRQGNVESVEILQGVNPLLDASLGNVRQWVFTPALNSLPAESHVTVVFLFRPRDLFSSAPIKSSPLLRRNPVRSPFPVEVSDPGYPVAAVGEGATVLELRVTPSGSLEGVRVVTDTPGLAAHTESAVRAWKFQPAMRNGTAVIGNVIVVASYLRPIINNHPASTGGPYYPYVPGPNPGSPASLPSTFNDGRPGPSPF